MKKSRPGDRREPISEKRTSKSGTPGSRSKTTGASRDKKVAEDLKRLEEGLAQTREQLLRTAAELDNLRKRHAREKDLLIETANNQLLKDILTVVDDLERSLKHAAEASGLQHGIELIYKKMLTVLRQYHVEPMETIGQPFDVASHDALAMVEKKGVSPGIVVDETEKGYLRHGSVLRHAKVIVSQ